MLAYTNLKMILYSLKYNVIKFHYFFLNYYYNYLNDILLKEFIIVLLVNMKIYVIYKVIYKVAYPDSAYVKINIFY